MNVVLIIALLVVAWIGLLRLRRWWYAPIKHRGVSIDELDKFLRTLLLHGEPGAFMIAEYEQSPGFIQIRLGQVNGEVVTFALGIPDVEWSHNFFETLGAQAEARGYRVTIDLVSDAGPVRRFHHIAHTVDLTNAVEEVVALCRFAVSAMGKADGVTFTVVNEGHYSGPRGWQHLQQQYNSPKIKDSDSRVIERMRRYVDKKADELNG